MYIVKWVDWCGNEHERNYKTAGRAFKKCFDVHGWYKNGVVIRAADGERVL